MSTHNAQEIAQGERVTGKAWGILGVTYLCSICAPLAQFKIPPLASWLFPVFGPSGLDSVSFGLLMSALAIIGVILAFPAAFIARRIGLKNTILLSVGCLGVGSAIGGLATTLEVLMLSRFLEGVGIGLIGVAAPACVTVWFPERKRGLALGIWATWVPLGSVVAFNTVPALAGMSGGYRLPMYAIAGLCLVAFILFAAVFKMPEGASSNMIAEGTFTDALKLLKNRRIWVLGIIFFLFSFTTIGIMNTYYNTFLETQLGFDAQTASSLSSLIMLISLFAAPTTGFICDRLALGRKYIVGVVMFVILLASGFCLFYTGEGAFAVIAFVIICQGVGGGMCGGSLRPMAPILMRGTAMGATMAMAVMQFCQNLGSAIGSPVFGALYPVLGWNETGMLLQIPCYVAGLVLCFFILPRGKNVKTLDDVPADKAWPKGF